MMIVMYAGKCWTIDLGSSMHPGPGADLIAVSSAQRYYVMVDFVVGWCRYVEGCCQSS